MYLRLFASAVDPRDREEILRLFHSEVAPVFARTPGCHGIELAVNVQPNAGGLVDGVAISRWESLDAMDAAVTSEPVMRAMARVSALLRHAPSIRVFELL